MHSNKRYSVSEASSVLGNQLDYEQVLEKIGFGRAQWIVLLISGLLTITSMATQFSMGIMVIASQCDFEMTQAQKGIFMASSVTGIFLSTYFWGYVSDAYGRRLVLLYSTFVAILLQFLTVFVITIWLFNILNLLIGISIGGISAAIYAYLSEYNTVKYRAIVINYSTTFVSVASIYVPVTAWWVLSADWSIHVIQGYYTFRPWRLIIIFNLLPGLLGALLLLRLPESPMFLLAQKKTLQALAALEYICKLNTGRTVQQLLKIENFTLKAPAVNELAVLGSSHACGILKNIWQATVPLFQKPHGFYFTLSAIAFFGMFFSSSGLQFWYPEIVNRSAGDNTQQSATVCEILNASFAKQALNQTLPNHNQKCNDSISTKTYVDSIILGFAFLIGFSTQGLFLHCLGRKNVLIATLVIAIICGILLHMVTNTIAVLIIFCLYILMPNLSISIMCGAVVDLVPTHLRGKGVAISLTLGRLGIVLAANLIGIMLEPLCDATFGVFTATMFVCAIIVFYLPI